MDHSSLKLALERAEELCSQVNEGVREKENSDRLEWIQAHVQCEGLAEVSEGLLGPAGDPEPLLTQGLLGGARLSSQGWSHLSGADLGLWWLAGQAAVLETVGSHGRYRSRGWEAGGRSLHNRG